MEEKVLIRSERYDIWRINTWIYFILFLPTFFVLTACLPDVAGMLFLFCAAGAGLIVGIVYLWLAKMEITVTNKRVCGKTAFGKRVDLPVDAISATATGWFKALTVATASGRISFLPLRNRDEIHSVISDLLIERQQKAPAIQQEVSQSNADELKKFKELLDTGVISQEEFDTKKKQLLGL